MQGFNHVAGGVAFTGIFASFSNVNIFEKPEYIAATVFFSLAADADHTRSIIGKLFFPLAKWINTKFGHRTITHSLLFYIGILVVIGFLESFFSFSRAYFVIAAFAYGSHIIFDMCTKQGVPLFWPISSRPAVLPGNPNLRLAVNDLRSESVVFLVFCSLTFFCMPLFANGFWLSFRKYFLTPLNVQKEFNQSSDYLLLSYEKEGKKLESTILEIEGQVFVLFSDRGVEKVQSSDIKLKDFKHSGRGRKSEVISIFQASPDSVQRFLSGKVIRAGELQSNQNIKYFESTIEKISKAVTFSWKSDFQFVIADSLNTNLEKVATLTEKRKTALTTYNLEIQERNALKNRLSKVIQAIPGASDYEAGKLILQRKSLEQRLLDLSILLPPDLSLYDQEIIRLSEIPKVYVSANLILEKP